MFRSSTNLRSLIAAMAIAAGSGAAFAQNAYTTSVTPRRGKGPDLSWATPPRKKPFGGSVKRHARAAAKARRSKR